MSNLGTLDSYVKVFNQLLDYHGQLEEHVKNSAEKGAAGAILQTIEEYRQDEDMEFINEDTGNLLRESIEGTQRVKEIVENLKNFARLDEAKLSQTDINDCLDNTLKVIWNEIKYTCEVVKEYGQLPSLLAKPGQLNQVFMNILVNAAHAIKDQGIITIGTKAGNNEILVKITDTGRGIPEEHLKDIFNPFFTTKPVGKGTGLGLSISYGIIQDHGGEIEVASKVGEGTTFTIHLPVTGAGQEANGEELEERNE
jgi:two-component system, NtrC family, sensor kinase